MLGSERTEADMASQWIELEGSLRREADDLLGARGLRAILNDYGQIHIHGAYRFKTLARPELDIVLVMSELDQTAFFEMVGRISEALAPAEMFFMDKKNHSSWGGYPNCLYLGVRMERSGVEAWKIDLSAMMADEWEKRGSFGDPVAAKLTDETRERIIEIKAQCWRYPGYSRQRWGPVHRDNSFGSHDIYNAVLDHGVEDLTGFLSYMEAERGEPLETPQQGAEGDAVDCAP